jgi:predicted RNA polymerase sigma factor
MAMAHGIATDPTTAPPHGLSAWLWCVCKHGLVDADRRARLRALSRAYKRADEKAEEARKSLAAEVLAALDDDVPQVEIVDVIGFSREWVRRQVVRERNAAS